MANFHNIIVTDTFVRENFTKACHIYFCHNGKGHYKYVIINILLEKIRWLKFSLMEATGEISDIFTLAKNVLH